MCLESRLTLLVVILSLYYKGQQVAYHS